MIPLVSTVEEFTTLKSQLVSTIQDLENDMKDKVHYLIGTMIETPRACLIVISG
jgi:pyruvate,orthophosphate dikinase